VDQLTVSNHEGSKHLLAIKLRIDARPVVYLGINNAGGRAAHTIQLTPTMAFRLADWICDDPSEGWGFEPGLMPERPAHKVQAAADVPDLRGEKATLVCYVLDVLAWKLPSDYGPAWLAGELTAAGIPIEWDSKGERFVPKLLEGAAPE
jgi:hypothetical protein